MRCKHISTMKKKSCTRLIQSPRVLAQRATGVMISTIRYSSVKQKANLSNIWVRPDESWWNETNHATHRHYYLTLLFLAIIYPPACLCLFKPAEYFLDFLFVWLFCNLKPWPPGAKFIRLSLNTCLYLLYLWWQQQHLFITFISLQLIKLHQMCIFL